MKLYRLSLLLFATLMLTHCGGNAPDPSISFKTDNTMSGARVAVGPSSTALSSTSLSSSLSGVESSPGTFLQATSSTPNTSSGTVSLSILSETVQPTPKGEGKEEKDDEKVERVGSMEGSTTTTTLESEAEEYPADFPLDSPYLYLLDIVERMKILMGGEQERMMEEFKRSLNKELSEKEKEENVQAVRRTHQQQLHFLEEVYVITLTLVNKTISIDKYLNWLLEQRFSLLHSRSNDIRGALGEVASNPSKVQEPNYQLRLIPTDKVFFNYLMGENSSDEDCNFNKYCRTSTISKYEIFNLLIKEAFSRCTLRELRSKTIGLLRASVQLHPFLSGDREEIGHPDQAGGPYATLAPIMLEKLPEGLKKEQIDQLNKWKNEAIKKHRSKEGILYPGIVSAAVLFKKIMNGVKENEKHSMDILSKLVEHVDYEVYNSHFIKVSSLPSKGNSGLKSSHASAPKTNYERRLWKFPLPEPDFLKIPAERTSSGATSLSSSLSSIATATQTPEAEISGNKKKKRKNPSSSAPAATSLSSSPSSTATEKPEGAISSNKKKKKKKDTSSTQSGVAPSSSSPFSTSSSTITATLEEEAPLSSSSSSTSSDSSVELTSTPAEQLDELQKGLSHLQKIAGELRDRSTPVSRVNDPWYAFERSVQEATAAQKKNDSSNFNLKLSEAVQKRSNLMAVLKAIEEELASSSSTSSSSTGATSSSSSSGTGKKTVSSIPQKATSSSSLLGTRTRIPLGDADDFMSSFKAKTANKRGLTSLWQFVSSEEGGVYPVMKLSSKHQSTVDELFDSAQQCNVTYRNFKSLYNHLKGLIGPGRGSHGKIFGAEEESIIGISKHNDKHTYTKRIIVYLQYPIVILGARPTSYWNKPKSE